MCFTVTKDNTKVLVAQEDIVCYKAFDYFIDEKLLKKERIKYSDAYKIESIGSVGFLSSWQDYKYSWESHHTNDALSQPQYEIYESLYEGFHSFINTTGINGMDGRYIIPCIIPKGARYMIQIDVQSHDRDRSVYISNEIIIGSRDQVTDRWEKKIPA